MATHPPVGRTRQELCSRPELRVDPRHHRLVAGEEGSGLTHWWRQRQVRRAARRMGYEPERVRYVHEIGQVSSVPLEGGVLYRPTGEILLDRFAFARDFLRQQGLASYRVILAHEIGHVRLRSDQPLAAAAGLVGGQVALTPGWWYALAAGESRASLVGAGLPGLRPRDVQSLLRHAETLRNEARAR